MNREKQTKQEAAKKYVDEQLEVLRKHGTAAPLTKDGYKNIVDSVVRATEE